MEEILKQFVNFVKCSDRFDRFVFVDLVSFKDSMSFHTPVQLPLTDPTYTFLNMPAVIIMNFVKNRFSSVEKYGLDALKKIVTKSTSDSDNRIQLMLMLHISKLSFIPSPARTYNNVEKSTGTVNVDEDTLSWIEIANKVLVHTEIGEIIKVMAHQTFGSRYSEKVSSEQNISVQIIQCNELPLRGFAGLDSVYINRNHFKGKALLLSLSGKGSDIEQRNVILLDVATVCLHELAHFRIREAIDNFNMSTPEVMVNPSVSCEREFGRIIEARLFGVVADWRSSFEDDRISSLYVDDFLEALNTNSELPPLPPGTVLNKRGSQTVESGSAGIDIAYDPDYVIE